MTKTKQLYEGKAKKVWATDDENIVIVDYKDDATAFNGIKKGTIVGKGVVNNKMSNYLMQILEKHGIPTHFVEELSDRETAVKKVKIVPLEVIIRNRAAGSICKRLGLEEGMDFVCPSIEFSYKDDELAIRSSTAIMLYHAVLQPKKMLKQSKKWHSRLTMYSRNILLQSALSLSTSSLNSAKQQTAQSFLQMKSALTPAVFGTSRLTKSLTRTDSVVTLAA